MKLIVNNGEFEFTRFGRATAALAEEYGYVGEVWEMVVASGDFDVLYDFLIDNGVDAQLDY